MANEQDERHLFGNTFMRNQPIIPKFENFQSISSDFQQKQPEYPPKTFERLQSSGAFSFSKLVEEDPGEKRRTTSPIILQQDGQPVWQYSNNQSQTGTILAHPELHIPEPLHRTVSNNAIPTGNNFQRHPT